MEVLRRPGSRWAFFLCGFSIVALEEVWHPGAEPHGRHRPGLKRPGSTPQEPADARSAGTRRFPGPKPIQPVETLGEVRKFGLN